MLSTRAIIEIAIRDKTSVNLTYDGYDRTISPHHVGLKENREQCLAWQTHGEAASGEVPGWKCMRLDRMQGPTVSPLPWETGPTHGGFQSCVDEIYATVDD